MLREIDDAARKAKNGDTQVKCLGNGFRKFWNNIKTDVKESEKK